MRRGIGAAVAAALVVAMAIGPAPLQADAAGEAAATARWLAAIRKQPPLLETFLRDAEGRRSPQPPLRSIYAESYIQQAEDGLCLITATFTLVAERATGAGRRPQTCCRLEAL
jgi:hypothetical protein